MTETVKVYVSGWIEYRVDNPEALKDAARFTPDELSPSNKAALGDVPLAAWDDHALLVEVSKAFTLNPPPAPPGATAVNQNVRYSLAPPTSPTQG